MANKKISEITEKASESDLSGARYIAAVPDGSGFVTKYVQGSGAPGSFGGVIDQVVKVNGGTGTLANFDNNTQVVMAQAVSNSGSSNFCGAQVQVPANNADTTIMKVGSGTLTTFYAKMRLNSDGSYNLTDTSRDHSFDFYITRFGKAG